MLTLSRFTNADLPVSFGHQIRDFIRIHWFDIFQYDIHARALPEEWKPVYFVLGDEPALYSHAGVSTQSVEVMGKR